MDVKEIRNANNVELDVRTIQEAGDEPFDVIMNAVKSLKSDDLFVLHSRIKPEPLITLMERKGFDHEVEQIDEYHWKINFKKGE